MKKFIATALQNIRFVQNGITVSILKGDSFEVFGCVFAYKNIIVDLKQWRDQFSIVRQQEPASVLTLKAKYDIKLTNKAGAEVTIKKGTIITVNNDIVAVQDCILDLTRWGFAFEPIALVAPTTPTGLAKSDEGYTFSWDEQADAESFLIHIDGEQVDEVETNSYTADETLFTPGTHTVEVYAKANGLTSEEPASIEVEVAEQVAEPVVEPVVETPVSLAAPTNLAKSAEGYTFSWDAVEGAQSYDVYLDAEKIASVETNSYEASAAAFTVGEHTVAVKAVAGAVESDPATLAVVVEAPAEAPATEE